MCVRISLPTPNSNEAKTLGISTKTLIFQGFSPFLRSSLCTKVYQYVPRCMRSKCGQMRSACGQSFDQPIAIYDFGRTIPNVKYGREDGASKVALYPYYNFLVSVLFCNVTHSFAIVAVRGVIAKHIFKQFVITTYAKFVALICSSGHVKQSVNSVVFKSHRRADCSTDAILCLYLLGIPIVIFVPLVIIPLHRRYSSNRGRAFPSPPGHLHPQEKPLPSWYR